MEALGTTGKTPKGKEHKWCCWQHGQYGTNQTKPDEEKPQKQKKKAGYPVIHWRKRTDQAANAPPHEEPHPAVQPKQWSRVIMVRWDRDSVLQLLI